MVFAAGETFAHDPVTVPTLGLTEMVVADFTDQVSVVDWPATSFAGEAANEEMLGGLPAAGIATGAASSRNIAGLADMGVL